MGVDADLVEAGTQEFGGVFEKGSGVEKGFVDIRVELLDTI